MTQRDLKTERNEIVDYRSFDHQQVFPSLNQNSNVYRQMKHL